MDEATQRRVNPVRIDWGSLPEELFLSIFSHFDVKTLIEKKQVCRTWRQTCTEAIDAKQTKEFSTNQELRQAVEKYCGYKRITNSYSQCNSQDAEEFAQTYGYPINKWDVSTLHDFSFIFRFVTTFNEDISSWNVLNATSMRGMFYSANAFNQNLSSWDVQNVTNMDMMFEHTLAFNGNISTWNVSHVTSMVRMFSSAKAFNQDLSSWDVQNVTDMAMMFEETKAFNGNMSSWNVPM
jgi:surface protein